MATSAGEALAQMMRQHLMNNFASSIPPESYLTPIGIKHIDAICGGGLTSSSPIFFSSTPETGKSTMALFAASAFQRTWENSVVMYIDTESSTGDKSQWMVKRLEIFGIDGGRFLYTPVCMNIPQVFQMLEHMIELKKQIEAAALQKTGEKKEYKIMFILDSITAIGSSKDISAEDPNKTIGLKAREMSFYLSKYMGTVAMNRVTFIAIDQVRANMKIASPMFSSDQKSVGEFGNFKSATNINSLQHALRQWLYLQKGQALKPTERFKVDGWIMHIKLEKNKLAPGNIYMPIVFDKKFGPVPVLSEYLFLSEMSKTERVYWKDANKLKYPLAIKKSGNKKVLEVVDPNSETVVYKSEPFSESKLIQIYNSDTTFHEWFDKSVEYSVQERIQKAIFRDIPQDSLESQSEDFEDEISTDENMMNFDPETGEVYDE